MVFSAAFDSTNQSGCQEFLPIMLPINCNPSVMGGQICGVICNFQLVGRAFRLAFIQGFVVSSAERLKPCPTSDIEEEWGNAQGASHKR